MPKIITFLLLLLIFSCKQNKSEEIIISKPIKISENELVNYIKYCNSRYDMCINYPSNFNPQPEPINGDGRTFTDEPDEAEISVFGYISNEKEPLKKELADLNSFLEISDLKEFNNGFEFIGIDEKSQFIHHGIILEKDFNHLQTIQSLSFIYPTDKTNKFKDYWRVISQDFK